MLRKNKNIFFTAISLILLVVFINSSIFSQPYTKEEKEILKIQDSRDFSRINIIAEYLKDTKSKAYLRALIAAGSMQDSTIVNTAGELLNSDASAHSLIGWVLGNINSPGGIKYLQEYINKPSTEKAAALLALGKIGDEEAFNTFLSNIPYKEFEIFQAYATAFFGIRKLKNEASFKTLSDVFNSPAGEHSLNGIAYAYYRTGDKKLLEPYKDILIKLIESNDPFTETRMWSFAALGKLQDTAFTDKLLYELDIEQDWRVRVNIANALGSVLPDLSSPLTVKLIGSIIQHAKEDNSTHVQISCLQSIAKLLEGKDTKNPDIQAIRQEILFMLSTSFKGEWNTQAEALKTYGRIFKDDAKSDLVTFFNTTNNYDLKAAAVSAFGYMNDPMVYKELRQMISDDVMKYNELHPNKDGSMIGSNDLAKLYRAFVGTLTELDDKMDKENRNIIRLILTEFSSSKDEPLTEICLSNLQDSIYLEYRNETCGIMTFDYPNFVMPRDKDVMLMFIEAWGNMKFTAVEEMLSKNLTGNDYDIAKASADALLKITGKDYSDKITAQKYRTDWDWDYLDALNSKKFAEIKTNRGSIKIELFTHIAPFTVQNFVKLAEKGFYNNTIFHRVVPNFVIQGGDPTGTGFGGPGYSIRSEFSPMPFDEYTVGMASSGKDTEGSQFFITHSPQPHLDGKYTVFGKVKEGKEIVDKIQIGDYIEAITFSAEK